VQRIFLTAVDVVTEFWRIMGTNDFDAVTTLLDDMFVLEWPQSNERIRGGPRFAQMNREYVSHGPWQFTVARLFGTETEIVTEVHVTDGVQRATAISFFTVSGHQIQRIVEYWPDSYPAPANRAHLVEAME
jgi:hypothetical protein